MPSGILKPSQHSRKTINPSELSSMVNLTAPQAEMPKKFQRLDIKTAAAYANVGSRPTSLERELQGKVQPNLLNSGGFDITSFKSGETFSNNGFSFRSRKSLPSNKAAKTKSKKRGEIARPIRWWCLVLFIANYFKELWIKVETQQAYGWPPKDHRQS